MRFLASQAAAGIGGRLVGPDVEIDGASFDTRALRQGQLFVPVVAERDGHDFIGAALEGGAAAYLTSRADEHRRTNTAIEVNDTSAALMALAGWVRRRSQATVVGVTGSVGKTSTKDLIAAACRTRKRTTANERSFNNEQGLPVTILNAADDTEVLVVEMGMRGFGEISRLCEIARPDVGVVTAVGEAHTERVGGIEGVARAKSELVAALPRSGTAVLNADDHRVSAMSTVTGASVLRYGTAGGGADVAMSDLVLDPGARPSFRIDTPWGSGRVDLSVTGAHMAANAAAAIAVAGTVGVPLEAAIAGLADAAVSGMRMEIGETASGARVVNDAYNANPTSMRAALEAVAAMDATRRFAVVGPMGELDDPAAGHRDIAAVAASLGIGLVAVGTDLYGVPRTDDPIGRLGELRQGDVVLVKASRAAGLERIAAALTAG